MIKLQDLTPDVYYKESRDFQFIGRLFDIVLNSIKTDSEIINGIPLDNDTDDQLIHLWATTLGFKTNKNYNINQLRAVCSVFSEALRWKGSRKAIELIVQAILSSEGIKDDLVIDDSELPSLKLLIPNKLSDINLLRDTLSYIIPVGTVVTIIRTTITPAKSSTELLTQNKVNYKFDNNDNSYGGNFMNDKTVGTVVQPNGEINSYDNNQAVQRSINDGTTVLTAVPGMLPNIKVVLAQKTAPQETTENEKNNEGGNSQNE